MSRLTTSFLLCLLTLASNSTWAGSIIYQFDTQLELESGLDVSGLDGAYMSFVAEIAEGTRYELDPITNSFPSFSGASYEWQISGGSTIDGSYAGGMSGTMDFVLWGMNHDYFSVGSFVDLNIVHIGSGGRIGSLVSAADFKGLLTEAFSPGRSLTTWSTDDGDVYDWTRNASFSAFEVPLPSTLLLFLSSLVIAAFRRVLTS